MPKGVSQIEAMPNTEEIKHIALQGWRSNKAVHSHHFTPHKVMPFEVLTNVCPLPLAFPFYLQSGWSSSFMHFMQ